MVNIGVVGCGYWGPKHIRVCSETTDARLTTVCDVDEKKLQQVRAQYPNVNVTTKYEELLNNVDAVVIATPVNTHYSLAKKALLHDKHVLIEKPMTFSSREALDLIEMADFRDLVLMVGHTYQYHPAVDLLVNIVNKGELGEIYSIDSDRLNLGLYRPDVNVLWDLAPHDISIMLMLLNQEPIAVSARGAHRAGGDVYDVAYIEILFANGVMGNVHVSWLHPRKIRQMTIVGSLKMAVYDDVSESEKVQIYDKGLVIPEGCSTNGNGNGNGHNRFSAWPPNYRYGNIVIPFVSGAEPLKIQCNHFISCIKENKVPKSDGWMGLKVTGILEAADLSLTRDGQRVKLDAALAGVI
jgi:predicted dehydrogenase